MAASKNDRITSLKEGKSYTYKLTEGGDLASMRGIFKYGQEITLSPVQDFHEVREGDIVYLKWHGGNYILHLVQEINGDQFLIVNSLGKINGWVSGSAILGKVTQIHDSETRPDVPEMLEVLHNAYLNLVQISSATMDDATRLEWIVMDLRWYMERIGRERWSRLPKQNRWSFESNLWYTTRCARDAAQSGAIKPIAYYVDQGKWIVGLAAEILALFEGYDWEYL